MNKEDLQQQLGIKTRQWQRWCSGLRFSASLESYSQEQMEQLEKLRQLLKEKVGFEDAIATITGKQPSEENPLRAALVKRAKTLIDALQPEAIGEYLVPEFDRRVATAFIKAAKSKKPIAFEQIMEGFDPLALEEGDYLEALLLEEGEDAA